MNVAAEVWEAADKLPDYDLIEESLLFSAALVKIDAGRFDTFVSQDIGEERNVIAAFHECFSRINGERNAGWITAGSR